MKTKNLTSFFLTAAVICFFVQSSYGWDFKMARVKSTDSPTGITSYSLSQNFPNPFNPFTTISFALPKATDVKLYAYNIIGEVISSKSYGNLEAGYYDVDFDASGLTSGVYFYKIVTSDFTQTKRMILIK